MLLRLVGSVGGWKWGGTCCGRSGSEMGGNGADMKRDIRDSGASGGEVEFGQEHFK